MYITDVSGEPINSILIDVSGEPINSIL